MIIYGSRCYGKVFAVQEQYLSTKFGHINFMPLVPSGSLFIIDDSDNNQYQALTVPLNGWSILYGYMRPWLFIATLLALIISLAAFEEEVAMGAVLMTLTALMAALWVFVMFFAGKLRGDEEMQCHLLYHITGIGLHPKRMKKDTVRSIWEDLSTKMVGSEIEVDPAHWASASNKPTEEELPILFCYALYANRLEPEGPWGELVERFWTQLKVQLETMPLNEAVLPTQDVVDVEDVTETEPQE